MVRSAAFQQADLLMKIAVRRQHTISTRHPMATGPEEFVSISTTNPTKELK
jgi:hypothetical protein